MKCHEIFLLKCHKTRILILQFGDAHVASSAQSIWNRFPHWATGVVFTWNGTDADKTVIKNVLCVIKLE